jgi:bifunctional DNA primase/polymerase-like protein
VNTPGASQHIFATARDYADLGLIPLPLAPNSKAPITPNWTTLRPRTLLRQVQPHHNIGIRLGKQPDGTYLFALDIDPRHDGTLAKLTQNRQFPTTAHDITAGDGEHYLLRSRVPVRTRIGLLLGVDLLGLGSMLVVEPSTIEGRPYLWLRGPEWGIADAPAWLLEDLRRGGVLAPRRSRRGQPARNKQARPQTPRKATERPRRASERAALLAEALGRFPLVAPGTRHDQMIRLLCAMICDSRQFSDDDISETLLAWWQHWYTERICNTPPRLHDITTRIHKARRDLSRGRIASPHGRHAALRAAVLRALPSYHLGGAGGRRAAAGRQARWGKTESSFVAALLLHFAREILLGHPLADSFPATNDQLIERVRRVSGIRLEGKQFRRLKHKFIGWDSKLPLLICTREGYRTGEERVPSMYALTPAFMQLLELL